SERLTGRSLVAAVNCCSERGGSGLERSYGCDRDRFVRFQQPFQLLKLVNQFSCTRAAVVCPGLSDSNSHPGASVPDAPHCPFHSRSLRKPGPRSLKSPL